MLQRQHRDTKSASSLLRRLGQTTILAAPSKTANQTSSSATADSTRKYAAVRSVLKTVKMAIGDGSESGSRVRLRWRKNLVGHPEERVCRVNIRERFYYSESVILTLSQPINFILS